VAWHWSQSCRDSEAQHWQRSFQAVEWWQRAAAAALDSGDHGGALPLLQRAQDVAAALESYFEGHSRSFILMRQQSMLEGGGAAAAKGGRAGKGGAGCSSLVGCMRSF
jgi:hypothetical protein